MNKRKTCGYPMIVHSRTEVLKSLFLQNRNDISKLWHVIMTSHQCRRLELHLNLGHVLGYNI